MSIIKAYRMLCRNSKCGAQFHRSYPVDEFELHQGGQGGWACFHCGYPRMQCYVSNKKVKDKLTFPSFQRHIGEFCKSEAHYKQLLKEKGIIEIGFENFPEQEQELATKRYFTDDIIKELAEEGITFDGQLVKALQDGSLEKDQAV